jgi:hypothetical protein
VENPLLECKMLRKLKHAPRDVAKEKNRTLEILKGAASKPSMVSFPTTVGFSLRH